MPKYGNSPVGPWRRDSQLVVYYSYMLFRCRGQCTEERPLNSQGFFSTAEKYYRHKLNMSVNRARNFMNNLYLEAFYYTKIKMY